MVRLTIDLALLTRATARGDDTAPIAMRIAGHMGLSAAEREVFDRLSPTVQWLYGGFATSSLWPHLRPGLRLAHERGPIDRRRRWEWRGEPVIASIRVAAATLEGERDTWLAVLDGGVLRMSRAAPTNTSERRRPLAPSPCRRSRR